MKRMNRFLGGILCLFILCLLTGCKTKQEQSFENGLKLYFLNKEETGLLSVTKQIEGSSLEELVDKVSQELFQPRKLGKDKKLFPENISLLGYSFGQAGQLILEFDLNYYSLAKITEILCRAAIVKSFCSIDGIDDVEFYVNGQPLLLAKETPVGMMSSEDFVNHTGEDAAFNQTMNLTVYFSNTEGTALKEYHRDVLFDGTLSAEQLVIRLLIQGPAEADKEVQTTLPKGTELLKVNVKDGICYVDFNEKFLERDSEISEEVVIYSVVNSLIELGYINKVQFLINGEQKKTYQTMDLSVFFERNLSIIETES